MNDAEIEDFLNNLKPAFYEPSGSWEFIDADGTYYNHSRQELRDPEEYDCNSEGYTPFGDE